MGLDGCSLYSHTDKLGLWLLPRRPPGSKTSEFESPVPLRTPAWEMSVQFARCHHEGSLPVGHHFVTSVLKLARRDFRRHLEVCDEGVPKCIIRSSLSQILNYALSILARNYPNAGAVVQPDSSTLILRTKLKYTANPICNNIRSAASLQA